MTVTEHLLERIARDPRLAYYFDPMTQSMEMLTEEYAQQNSLVLEDFRRDYYSRLKFEAPCCQECGLDYGSRK